MPCSRARRHGSLARAAALGLHCVLAAGGLVAQDFDCASPSGERYPARVKIVPGGCSECLGVAAQCADAIAAACDARPAQQLGTGACAIYGDGKAPLCPELAAWTAAPDTGQGLPPQRGDPASGWRCYGPGADCSDYPCEGGTVRVQPAPACACCGAGCSKSCEVGGIQTCTTPDDQNAAVCCRLPTSPSTSPTVQPAAATPSPPFSGVGSTVSAVTGTGGDPAVATVAAVAGVTGNLPSAQRLGALFQQGCAIEDDVDPDTAPWQPSVFSGARSAFSNGLFGNAALLLITGATHSLVVGCVWLWRQRAAYVPGPGSPAGSPVASVSHSLGVFLKRQSIAPASPRFHTRELRDARAVVRFPALIILLCVFLYPGSAICAWKLIMYGSGGEIASGLAIAVTALVMCPCAARWWVGHLDAQYADMAPRKDADGSHRLVSMWRRWGESYMLGHGEWVSTSQRRAVQCYGLLFEQYREGQRCFLFVEQASLLVITLLASIEQGSCGACAGVSSATGAVLMGWLGVCWKLRPWASRFENHYNVLAASTQLMACLLSAISMAYGEQKESSCSVEHWTGDAKDILLVVCTALALGKLGVDVLLLLYSQVVGRRKRLQKIADSSLPGARDTDDEELAPGSTVSASSSHPKMIFRRSTVGANFRVRRASTSSSESDAAAGPQKSDDLIEESVLSMDGSGTGNRAMHIARAARFSSGDGQGHPDRPVRQVSVDSADVLLQVTTPNRGAAPSPWRSGRSTGGAHLAVPTPSTTPPPRRRQAGGGAVRKSAAANLLPFRTRRASFASAAPDSATATMSEMTPGHTPGVLPLHARSPSLSALRSSGTNEASTVDDVRSAGAVTPVVLSVLPPAAERWRRLSL
eukprot:TRINITY_DN24275_c0_g1_i1.p1 TRINITY_DN24275_c0_g1~~TRINITY_DN24275_c0_g1_i1.p1  ORF type:complete len:885 (+),score=110.12 TRINITY_DN24275_c0_g1_i1:50-2656(+)